MAQIAVTDQEASEWQPKINSIIDWFGQLQQVDVTGVAPAIHATEQGTALRVDEARLHEARADLLAMSPSLEKSYVRVPKIGTGADAQPSDAADASATPSAAAAEAAAPKPTAAAHVDMGAPPTPSDLAAFHALDLRVGKIVSCEKHPEADSLYVERIDVGEPEPRVIVSGLVKYVPLEQMQDRMVVVICNLKPRNMRGIKSFGMVLAASNEEHTVVEPLLPPEGSSPGDRVWAGDVKEQPAPATANVVEKKKHWEAVQPFLKTGEDCVASWRNAPLQVAQGAVKASTLVGARVA